MIGPKETSKTSHLVLLQQSLHVFLHQSSFSLLAYQHLRTLSQLSPKFVQRSIFVFITYRRIPFTVTCLSWEGGKAAIFWDADSTRRQLAKTWGDLAVTQSA